MVSSNILILRTNEHLFKILCNILNPEVQFFAGGVQYFSAKYLHPPPLSYKIVNSECGIQNLAGKY